MQVNTVAQELGITLSRLNTIANHLLGNQKTEFTPEEVEQVAGVVRLIRLHNERSVKKAVELYQQGVAAETRVDPRANLQQQQSTSTVGKTGGLKSSFQDSQQMAYLLAEKEVTATLELKNLLVAEWFATGIPTSVISQESRDRLEASREAVYATTLGSIDASGNYLPALVQSGRMLSAAVED